MIPQRVLRSASAWAPLAERRVCARQFHASAGRQHSVPILNYKDAFEKDGVPGLLSPQGYDVAYTQNMKHLIDRLNQATKGSEHYDSTTKALVLQFARNPTFAAIFSSASLAHNNHFFFDALSPIPNPLHEYPSLQEELVQAFGSIDILRRTMLTTANAMHGPGYVWLVQARLRSAFGKSSRLPQYRIVTTYNAGTPYPEAGFRRQGQDMNTVPAGSAGAFGPSSAANKNSVSVPPGTELITPILCVSTWEHVYLADYGVGNKQKYLLKWWNSINWGAVDRKTEKSSQTLGQAKGFQS